jgi:hypothetical protein
LNDPSNIDDDPANRPRTKDRKHGLSTNGLAAAPPGIGCIIGVSTST